MTEDGFRSDGWRQMLSIYIARPLDTAIDRAGQGYTYAELYTDPAKKAAWETVGAATSCPAWSTGRPTARRQFFLNFAITLQKPEPPQSIKDELVKQQAAVAAARAAQAEAEAREAAALAQVAGREGRGAEDPGPRGRARSAGLPAAVRHRQRAQPVPAVDELPDHRRRAGSAGSVHRGRGTRSRACRRAQRGVQDSAQRAVDCRRVSSQLSADGCKSTSGARFRPLVRASTVHDLPQPTCASLAWARRARATSARPSRT